MKSGFWHLPAKVTGAIFLVIAVSGLAMAGASALPIDAGDGVPDAGVMPVSIERVFTPDGGDVRIAADRLSFVLSLPPGDRGSFTGTLDLRNTDDNAIMVDVTASNPDSMFIDFIDPLYGVSGQSGRQHWRLYLRGNEVSTIVYLLQAGRDSEPGSHEIEVTIIPEEPRFSFTPLPAGQTMWGGDGPAPGTPPVVIHHIWPMFRYIPSHTGRTTYTGLSHQIITIPGIFKTSASSPAIADDGTIYMSQGNNWLFALNPAGNMPIWWYDAGDDIHSSPAIAPDGTIYVGSDDNALHAVNPDGSPKWTYDTLGDVFSSPAIGPDGTIYFGSFDNHLYAVREDGTLKWEYLTGGDILSSPAIGPDGTIYIGSSDKQIYALNHDGTLKWFYTTGDVVHSSPAVAPDGTVYVGSADGSLYALNPDNGIPYWSRATGNRIDSSPAIGSDGTVYVGSFDSKLYALNPADGSDKWPPYVSGGPVYSSPAIDADGTIFFATVFGGLYALNPVDGSEKWLPQNFGLWFYSSPVITDDGRVLYIRGTGGPGA
jgi:outer membrane protein assembly factor BamB